MKIKTTQSLSNLKDWQELARFTDIAIADIVAAINGRLSLTDNCLTSLVTVVFSGASITVAAPHTLGITPTGYIVVGKSSAIHVFDGTSLNDKNNLYVQASAAGTVRLLIF